MFFMPFIRSLSIRRALLSMVFLSLLPALGIIIYSGFETGRELEKSFKRDALNQVISCADVQNTITASIQGFLSSLSRQRPFREENVVEMQKILKDIYIKNSQYSNLAFVNRRRIVTAASLLPLGTVLENRQHIEAAFRTRSFSAGEFLYASLDGKPSMAYAMPVFDTRGTVVGVLSISIALDTYAEYFKGLQIKQNTPFLGILDRKGRRLFFYPPREENPLGGTIKEDVWEEVSTNPLEEGGFTNTNSLGIEHWFAYKRLYLALDTEPYMYVVYATPVASARAVIQHILWRNSLLVVVVAAFSVGIVLLLSRFTFGRRLQRIVAVAKKLDGGDLSARVEGSDTSSDLGRISASLNHLAETIQSRHLELEENAQRLTVMAEQKEMLLRELHHRVKNNLQLILSLINITPETNPAERPLRESLERRISAISLLHEMLHHGDGANEVDIFEYISRLLNLTLGSAMLCGDLNYAIEGDGTDVRLDIAVPLGLVVNEILTNSLKYACPDEGLPQITVKLSVSENRTLEICIGDNGPGIRDKGLKPNGSPGGIGFVLVEILMQQLRGDWNIKNDDGASICLTIPLPPLV